MTTILAPIDFSDVSTGVVNAALLMAKNMKAHLILFHVVEPIPQFVGGEAAFDMMQAPIPQDLDQPKKEMKTLISTLQDKDVEISSSVTLGLPVYEIMDAVEKHKVDYIVVGSHGHGALYHLFSGSVVTGILEKATCPVVVVPAAKKK
ncbi:MAG: universal stress protein [Chthoniobacterales bacterium]